MPTLIGALRISLGLETAAFETGSKRAAAEVDALGTRMEKAGFAVGRLAKGVGIAAAAFAGSQIIGKLKDMAREGLETASALGEQATQLGVSTSALQRYRFIASQVGIEQDEMDKGLAKLSLSLGKMSLDPEKAAKAMAKYGIDSASALKLSKMNAEDALPFIADRYKALGSDTERAALVAELFGSKMGAKFKTLLEGGSGAINQMADAYKRLNMEISPEQIAKADAAMDQMAANQKAIDAQIAKMSSDAAPQLARAEMAWAKFKLDAIRMFADAVGALDSFNRDYYARYVKWAEGVRGTLAAVPGYVRKMVSDVQAELTGRLGKVMEGAKAKFAAVKDAAFDMWDKVTRRSYVPDMVDDIEREMARLDGVMVQPADKATKAVKTKFKALADELQPLLDRLFPDIAAARQQAADLALIDKGAKGGAISAGTALEARARVAGGERQSVADIYGFGIGDTIEVSKQVRDAIDRIGGVTKDNADKTEAANVRIAKSFKDMADETLSKLSSLASAIKSGGFLGILQGLLGFGLQLGSIGAFGKTVADRLATSKIPGYAGGTGFHPGGLALVGERGPELVNLPRGSKVYPNGTGPGGGNSYTFQGNLMTPEFWAMIQSGDERAMRNGAGLAHMQSARSRQWALG